MTGPNVLTDPIFTLATGDGAQHLTLPGLIARLLTDGGAVGLPRLPADQHGPVWRFLVRCAAQALHTAGHGLPADTTDPSMLTSLLSAALVRVTGSTSAFALENGNGTEPAFLQPPVAGGQPVQAAGYRAGSASRLTLAMGGKGHERKPDADRSLDAEALVYALIAYQSGVIYTKGNYASQLMGSATGKGSGMPIMRVRFDGGLHRSFRHDVGVLLDRWDDVRRERGLTGAVWALWTVPWDGSTPLGSEALTPAFIPCARLVRIGAPGPDGRFAEVWFLPTKKARVEDRTDGSGLGDPFLPQVPNPRRPGDHKARGTMGTGYRYDEVVRLLFGGEDGSARPSPTVASLLDAGDVGTVRVVFEGMAFDQGKTLGFHSREVLLPEGNLLDLRDPDLLRETHGEFLRRVKDAQSALRGAARILLNGSPRPRTGDAAKIDLSAQALQYAVDTVYVDALLDAVRRRRAGEATAVDEWSARVRTMALDAHAATQAMVPTPTTQRLRREVEAESFVRRKLALTTALNPDPVTP